MMKSYEVFAENFIGQALKMPPVPVSLLFTKEKSANQRHMLRQTDQWGAPIYKMHWLMKLKLYSQNVPHRSLHKNGKHFFVFQATVNLRQIRRIKFHVKNIFHLVEIYEKAKNAWFTVFPSHHLPIWLFDSFVWIYKNL